MSGGGEAGPEGAIGGRIDGTVYQRDVGMKGTGHLRGRGPASSSLSQ